MSNLQTLYHFKLEQCKDWGRTWRYTVTSYRVDKVKFKDGRTDAGNDNSPLAWKA